MWRPSASLFKAQPCIWVTCTCAAARTSSQTTYTVTGVTGFVQLGPSRSVHLGKDAVYSIVSVLSSYKLLIPFLLQAWYPSLSWHLRLLFKKKKKRCGGLHSRHLFLTVLEAGSPRSGCLRGQAW